MENESPIIPGISQKKRYKAAVRLLDGSDVRVYSTREHPTSHYGLQVWCDREGNAYGQIDLRHPLYLVHAIEEIDEDEAAIFDGYASRREACARGGRSTSETKRAAVRANGAKGGRPVTSVEDCFCAGRRGFGSARGYYADGRFRVSAREAARLVRVWELGTPENLSEVYVLDDSGRRVPVWTR